MPGNSVLASIVSCWLIILIYSFDTSETAYTYLLALSGFTGAIAWISICWSQLRFRRKMEREGKVDTLRYKTPFFPYVTYFGIWIQIFCLLVMFFTDDLRETLLVGVPFLVCPMLWYRFKRYSLRIREEASQSA